MEHDNLSGGGKTQCSSTINGEVWPVDLRILNRDGTHYGVVRALKRCHSKDCKMLRIQWSEQPPLFTWNCSLQLLKRPDGMFQLRQYQE